MSRTINRMMKKLDGWVNVLTGMGLKNRDKLASADTCARIMDQTRAESLYQSDDIAARIVNRIPEEMLREGYQVVVENDPKLGEKAMMKLEEHKIDEKLERALKWNRLYGGSAIIIGIGNQPPEEPLNLKDIKKVDYFTPLDRYRLCAEMPVEDEVESENFGNPNHYTIQSEVSTSKTVGIKIHYSRMILFKGVELPYNLYIKNNYWGDSVLSRSYNAIRNYQTAFDNVASAMQDFAPLVVKIKGLADLIASGNHALVTQRLELATLQHSIMNALVLDSEGEDAQRQTTSFEGIPEILTKMGNRLVASNELPHTILLGESPQASNATGNSTTMSWYDSIKNEQKSVLVPPLNQTLDVIFSEQGGISGGKIPDYKIVFNPLWQLDLKEQAQINEIQAKADAMYIDRNVFTSDEIRDGRSGDEINLRTQVDGKLQQEFEQEE